MTKDVRCDAGKLLLERSPCIARLETLRGNKFEEEYGSTTLEDTVAEPIACATIVAVSDSNSSLLERKSATTTSELCGDACPELGKISRFVIKDVVGNVKTPFEGITGMFELKTSGD